MNAGQQTVEWVHAGIAEWMRPVISMAAALQVSEANALWHLLKDFLPAHENTSVPPQSGLRNTPDEIAEIVSSWVQPLGQQRNELSRHERLPDGRLLRRMEP